MTKVNQAIIKQYNFIHTLQHKDDKPHFRVEEKLVFQTFNHFCSF